MARRPSRRAHASRIRHGEQCKHDEIDGDDDRQDGHHEYHQKPARALTSFSLARPEVHCDGAVSVPGAQLKLTFGASRIVALAISSICIGAKSKFPAMKLFGKTSLALL